MNKDTFPKASSSNCGLAQVPGVEEGGARRRGGEGDARRLRLREEQIKRSMHVLHGAGLLQFQDMINLRWRGISPEEFN